MFSSKFALTIFNRSFSQFDPKNFFQPARLGFLKVFFRQIQSIRWFYQFHTKLWKKSSWSKFRRSSPLGVSLTSTHFVSPFSCCCCVVEQKNKSNKFTFCIRTTHNWFNRITKRFSTSVGYLTPKLVVRILSNGRKNDSCTNNSWWRELVTNCSYNFNCSNRTAFAYLTMKKQKEEI